MTKKGTLTGIVGFHAPKGRAPQQEIPAPKPKPAAFEIISTDWCSFCKRAKEKLDELGLTYRESLLDSQEKIASFKAAGFTTVPQIYHNGSHIGGYMELLDWLEKNHAPTS
ncbi:glutaredoxin [Phaeobacter gallaeciensis]|uniref:glutaredoxin family protein n=1 Tax=Phaeobacter gallaeciensis TaxID=60890 RepID=UPI002380731A|nr:glutaredoxin [Phaeobacter gallaeciensis]MDE4297186.1 glutaredoxin [Phaeobacter gallaeciensis]